MVDVLLGLVFGDEGKGKIVDKLAPNYDVVARFNGGNNAGHSIVFNGKTYVLHLIPSGIFFGKICVIGNGVVIDPIALKKEIEGLESDGIEVKKNLLISKNAHLIRPKHIEEETDSQLHNKIGTTKKGIGPCYTDKVKRTGKRICDIIPDELISIFQFENPEYSKSLEYLLSLEIINLEQYLNTNPDLKILAEGAQGTFLDVDFGTYPFVTSSNTTIGSVITGLGIPPQRINKVYGVFKAYMTRVGNGPFVSELLNGTGEKLRELGGEFGATTGRPRRCGWLDLPMLSYSCMINGVTDLIMTKSDILNDFDEVNICTGYETPIETSNFYSNDIYTNSTKPIYKKFNGWSKSNQNPLEEYIRYIESETKVPVTFVSCGKERDSIYQR